MHLFEFLLWLKPLIREKESISVFFSGDIQNPPFKLQFHAQQQQKNQTFTLSIVGQMINTIKISRISLFASSLRRRNENFLA